MKCPKCGYVSHDYLDACRKCSIDLVSFKHEISLAVLEPGLLDLSLAIAGNGVGSMSSVNGSDGGYNDSDDFLDGSMLVETETPESDEDEEVDIRLDDDLTNAMPTANQGPSGSLTREFFVPDELLAGDDHEALVDDAIEGMDAEASSAPGTIDDIAQPPITEEILNLDFDDETISSETFFTESMTSDSTDVIDMNALQELRDSHDEPEDVDVEDIEAALEVDDIFSHDMDSAAIELEDTLLDEDATLIPSDDQDEVQANLLPERSAEFNIGPLQDIAADEAPSVDIQDDAQLQDDPVEPLHPSGSLELPADFQLGDFQTDDTQLQDDPVEPLNPSGSLELPADFQLGDSAPDEPTADEQSEALADAPTEPEPSQPQSEQQPRSEKITLSFPIDPNTETLFFDQLSDTAEVTPTAEPESTDTDATEASPSKPVSLDDLASELSPVDQEQTESTLELDLEFELPAAEASEEEATEIPIDTDTANQDNSKTQS